MKELDAARNTARLAGEELMIRLKKNGDKNIHQKNFGETVTNFDREINQFIIDEIQAHFPDHDIVTEEAEVIDASSDSDRWFIDPIDGTNNFVRNIPMYCVSVGYEKDGKLFAGAIYDPVHKTMFTGGIGEGAFMDKTPMKVSSIDKLDEAMIFEGHGYDPKYKKQHAKIMLSVNEEAKSRRNLGTAALMLAYVARGDADAMIVTGIKPWDCAAAVVMIREAGGKVTNYQGEEWMPKDEMIVASNGVIHEKLLEIVG